MAGFARFPRSNTRLFLSHRRVAAAGGRTIDDIIWGKRELLIHAGLTGRLHKFD